MKIVVHIGSTKTGSSAFQSYCDRLREPLKQNGILYPQTGIASSAHHLLAACLHPSARGLHADFFQKSNEPPSDVFKRLAESIEKEASERSYTHIILSSEYLWGVFDPSVYEQWKAAFSFGDLHLAAVLRRPDVWIQSSFLQTVKYGEKRHFDEWYKTFTTQRATGADYLSTISNWSSITMPEKTHLFTYERLITKGGSSPALLRKLTGCPLTAPEFREPDGLTNPSPDPSTLELLLAVNQSNIPPATQAGIRRVLLSQGGKRKLGADIEIITPEARQAILSDYKGQIEQLIQKFNVPDLADYID